MNALACFLGFGSGSVWKQVWMTWTYFLWVIIELLQPEDEKWSMVSQWIMKGWRGRGYRLPGTGVKVWSLRRNPEVIVLPEIDLRSLPHTQQSNFTLISQQCFSIPTKALFLTAYKTMALREDWGLGLPGAIKYDGLLSDSEEEGDAFPWCFLQPDCCLLTAVTSERGLVSQML